MGQHPLPAGRRGAPRFQNTVAELQELHQSSCEPVPAAPTHRNGATIRKHSACDLRAARGGREQRASISSPSENPGSALIRASTSLTGLSRSPTRHTQAAGTGCRRRPGARRSRPAPSSRPHPAAAPCPRCSAGGSCFQPAPAAPRPKWGGRGGPKRWLKAKINKEGEGKEEEPAQRSPPATAAAHWRCPPPAPHSRCPAPAAAWPPSRRPAPLRPAAFKLKARPGEEPQCPGPGPRRPIPG